MVDLGLNDRALYKDHPIYATAVPRDGGGWFARGIVLAPRTEATIELIRLEPGEIYFETEGEAKEMALALCRIWLDDRER